MFSEYFVMGERQCYPVARRHLARRARVRGAAGGGAARGEPRRRPAGQVGADHRRRHDRLPDGAWRRGFAGARKITVTDVLDRPLAQAREVGADVTLRADRDGGRARTNRSSTSLTRSRATSTRSRRASRPTSAAASIVQVGTLPHEPLPFVVNELMAKELDLRGAFRWGIEFDWAVDYLVDAPRRRAAAAVGPVSAAGRGRRIRGGSRQEPEHEGARS